MRLADVLFLCVAELRNNLSKMQEGATAALIRGGVPVYSVLPSAPTAGGKVLVRYNRRSGPMGNFPIAEGTAISLLYGFNGWQDGGKVAMSKVAVAPGATGEEADVGISGMGSAWW